MWSQARETNSLIQILRRSNTRGLHTSGSWFPNLLVHIEPCLDIIGEVVPFREDYSNGRGVFDRLTGSLRLSWLGKTK